MKSQRKWQFLLVSASLLTITTSCKLRNFNENVDPFELARKLNDVKIGDERNSVDELFPQFRSVLHNPTKYPFTFSYAHSSKNRFIVFSVNFDQSDRVISPIDEFQLTTETSSHTINVQKLLNSKQVSLDTDPKIFSEPGSLKR